MSGAVEVAKLMISGAVKLSDLFIKYPQKKYQQSLDKLGAYYQELDKELGRVKELKSQLENSHFWDDDQAAAYLNSMNIEIRAVENAQNYCNNAIQTYQEVVKQMEDESVVSTLTNGIANAVDKLGVK